MAKHILNTNNRYTISENGIVYDKLLNRVVTQYKKPNGYMFVPIVKDDGKVCSQYVHRLVAMAFIPNPNQEKEVNHIDGDKENNSKENLEWVSHSENQKHRYRVLMKPDIRKGRRLFANMKPVIQMTMDGVFIKRFESLIEASMETKSCYSNISQCLNGKRKSCNGYKWARDGDLR